MNRKIPWARGLAELTVIVLGVLIALWVESLREWRGDRAAEHQYVERLIHDLEGDSVNVERVLYFNDIYRQSATHLLSFLDGEMESDDTPSELAHHIAWATYLVSLTLQNSTFKELVGSGRLGLLRDVEALDDLLLYHRLLEGRVGKFETAPRELSRFGRQNLPSGFTRAAQECLWDEWNGRGRCRAEISEADAIDVVARLRSDPAVPGYLREIVWFADDLDWEFRSQEDIGADLRASLRGASSR